MAKEVNIHVKTTGAGEAKQQVDSLGQSVEEMGAKTSRAGGWMKEAFTALVGPLGIAALVSFAVAGIRKLIAAFDDMKKAASEAVHEMANQQRAAASFFEAMDAYSGPQRKAALTQARGVQARTGLPFEESKQLLEAQKRTFGEINPQATDQFAAYSRLHAGTTATTDLIRWMGESGVKTPERQGQIMRMISAVSSSAKLKDEDLIQALASRGERLRSLGWSPEQAITNVGKAIGGLSSSEANRALRGLFESLTVSEETAKKLGVPKNIRDSEQATLEWIKNKAEALPPDKRAPFMREAFGASSPYVSKMFFGQTPPATPVSAEEEAKRIAESLKTEEALLEMGKGKEVQPPVTPEKTTQALIREQGKAYLENYLRTEDRLKYEQIKALPYGEEYQYERAAELLWGTGQPKRRAPIPPVFIPGGGLPAEVGEVPTTWEGVLPEERLAGAEKAAQTINIHYHNETIYTPRVGSDERGPRTPANIK
jgi:hypothetical protein